MTKVPALEAGIFLSIMENMEAVKLCVSFLECIIQRVVRTQEVGLSCQIFWGTTWQAKDCRRRR